MARKSTRFGVIQGILYRLHIIYTVTLCNNRHKSSLYKFCLLIKHQLRHFSQISPLKYAAQKKYVKSNDSKQRQNYPIIPVYKNGHQFPQPAQPQECRICGSTKQTTKVDKFHDQNCKFTTTKAPKA